MLLHEENLAHDGQGTTISEGRIAVLLALSWTAACSAHSSERLFSGLDLQEATQYVNWWVGALFVAALALGYALNRKLSRKLGDPRTAQQASLGRDDLLRLALEAAQTAVWDFYPAGGEPYLSDQGYAMLGYPPADGKLTAAELKGLIHPEDLPRSEQAFRDYTDTGARGAIEVALRMRKADGTWIWVMVRGRAVAWDASGAPSRIMGSALSIQALQKSQEDLVQSEAKLRAIFENEPYENEPYEEEARDILDELVTTGPVKDREASVREKDGTLGHVIRSSVPLNIQDQQHVLSMTVDVSDIKQTDKALKESEARFHSLFALAPLPLALISRDGKILEVNDRLTQIMGYTIEEVPTLDHWWELAYPDPDYRSWVISDWAAVVDRAQGSGSAVELGEYRVTCRDGTERTMVIGANVVGDSLLVSFFNVTERKLAEEAVDRERNNLRAILHASPVASLVFDETERVIDANLAFERLFGRGSSELRGSRCSDLLQCVDRQANSKGCGHLPRCPNCLLAHSIRECLNANVGAHNREAEAVIGSDGPAKHLWLRFSAEPFELNGRKHVIMALDDITERRQEETARLQSMELLRATFDATPDGILVVDREGRITQINRQFLQMWRIPHESQEIADTETLMALVRDQVEDPDVFQSGVKALYDSRLEHLDEIRFKDGRVFERYSSPMALGGKEIGRVWDFRDISERKRAEEAADFQRRQLLSIFDNLNEIIYVSDPFTHEILFANQRLRDLIGKDPTGVCYRELQGLDRPCDFCTNELILNNGGVPHRWEFHNPAMNIDVAIVDQIIRWPDGRDVRLEFAVDITERKRAEEELRASERKLRSLFAAMMDVILILDSEGRYIEIAPTNTAFLYRPREELLGKSVKDVFAPEMAEHFLAAIRRALSQRKPVSLDYDLMIGPRKVWFAASVSPLSSDRVICVARDITDRKRGEEEREKLQEQLLQARKLEAVGTLAGGVAHDFNNMLGAIIGYTELIMRDMDPANPFHKKLEGILDAAQRSAGLTGQLLAFARKQTVAPVVLDVNESVEAMLTMLRRLIGENIALAWLPGTGPCTVRMDPSQLDQVLANLCVNARDAISDVGKITIETDTVSFDTAYCEAHIGFYPGDYVLLAVSDDGCGMEKETVSHIFEPFFTTKGLGHGTGLGLATVYGIVGQNEGFTHVYSEPGNGATFRIYLPRHGGEAVTAGPGTDKAMPHSRGEAILIVEDDATLLEMGTMMLQRLGYSVLSAGTPGEAIRLAEKESSEIDLLITDVVMPEMNGRDLAERLLTIRPTMKCLFMSGYSAHVIAPGEILDKSVNYMQKPFSLKDLAVKIREVLGRK